MTIAFPELQVVPLNRRKDHFSTKAETDRTGITRSKMGRRKSKRQAPQKRKVIEPMDLQFMCPFCNHEKSCEVEMDKVHKTAKIKCRVCLEDYQTTANALSEPIDIYSDWIDACDAIN